MCIRDRYEEVQGIPAKVQEEIDAMMADYDKSDFKPVSYASAKNTNVSLCLLYTSRCV